MNEPTRMFDKYTKIWRELGFYERLEQIAAIFLSVLVSIIVVYACGHIASDVYKLLILQVDLAAPDTFRNLFAGILTVLIALEFNHSIVQVIERKTKHCSSSYCRTDCDTCIGEKIYSPRFSQDRCDDVDWIGCIDRLTCGFALGSKDCRHTITRLDVSDE